MSYDHFLGKNGLLWGGLRLALPSLPFAGSEERERGGLQHPRWASRPLTCMGLHVLQQVVVELELDSTGATGVRF